MTDDIGSYRKVYFVMPKGQHTAVTDHLGNHYETEKAMADAYHISLNAFRHRVHTAGWTVKDALTTPTLKRQYTVRDHNGTVFSSVKEMCAHHGISETHFRTRRRNGQSIQAALTKTTRSVHDHDGNQYDSVTEMCQHYDIPLDVYTKRIKQGWSIKRALTEAPSSRSKHTFSYNGNTYHSVLELVQKAEDCNISANTLYGRLRSGWTVNETITTQRFKRPPIEYQGKSFLTYADIAKHYNIRIDRITSCFRRRINEQWPPEALALPMNQAWKLAFIVNNTPYFYTSDGQSCDIQSLQHILKTKAQPLHYVTLNYMIHHLDEPVPLDITHT